MKKIRLFNKSLSFSFKLIYKSSGFIILWYFILNIVSSTMAFINTWSLKRIIDSLLFDQLLLNVVVLNILIYAVVHLIQCAIQAMTNIMYNTMIRKAEHYYDCILLNKMKNIPLSEIDSSTGRNAIEEVKYSKSTAVAFVQRLVRIIILSYTFSLSIVTLVAFDLWFSMLFVLLTVPGILINHFFSKSFDEFRRKTAPDIRKFSYYRWMLTDAKPAKDVRLYNLTESIKKRYNEEKNVFVNASKKLDVKRLRLSLFAEFLKRSGELFFIVVLVVRACKGDISVADITLYSSMAIKALNSFDNLSNMAINQFTVDINRMERIMTFLEKNTTPKNTTYRPLVDFQELYFDNVYFKYPYSDKYILSGVSFRISRGDKVFLVGLNGEGKTTIIKLMLGMYNVDSGNIFINGYPITDYSINDVRRLFSVLFQNYVNYPLSLRENVSLSMISETNEDEKIIDALKCSDIYDDIYSKLTYGLDTLMTKKFDDQGVELSKGQWQRIAIARTCYKKSDVIILDEPSASLDAKAEDNVFTLFASLSNNKTCIMISHRIAFARKASKILVLNQGKVVESGTHDSLMGNNGLYANLYNTQRQKYAI